MVPTEQTRTVMTFYYVLRSNLTLQLEFSNVISYCSVHFLCISCSNEVLLAAKCDDSMYDLDLKVKSKFYITSRFLTCGFLFMFNFSTFHEWIPQMLFPINVHYISYMSALLQLGATVCSWCFQYTSYESCLTFI